MQTYNINHTGVDTSNQGHESDQEDKDIQGTQCQVLRSKDATLSDEEKPHQGREVKGKAGQEKGRHEREQVIEEWDDLRNDKSNDHSDSDGSQPSSPSGRCVDKSDVGVLENASMNHATENDSIDRATDEDNRQGDAEDYSAKSLASGEKGGTLNILSDEGVDQSTGAGVNDHLDSSQCADRFGEIFRSVHLIHEGDLTNGDCVCENNIRHGNEGLGEGNVLFGPG